MGVDLVSAFVDLLVVLVLAGVVYWWFRLVLFCVDFGVLFLGF